MPELLGPIFEPAACFGNDTSPRAGDGLWDGRVEEAGVGMRPVGCEKCVESAPRLRISDVFLTLFRCRAASWSAMSSLSSWM